MWKCDVSRTCDKVIFKFSWLTRMTSQLFGTVGTRQWCIAGYSPDFSVFTPASESEIYKILLNCPNKQHLSAAFDAIDRDILITRLSSWFGIHGSVFSWFKSYLSSRCFHGKCENYLSSWYTSSCSVPQGSVSVLSSCTPLLSVLSFPLVP